MYMPDLHLKSLLYGYIVGSSDVTRAKLQLFNGPPPLKYVLGYTLNTEGLLFQLAPDRVADWLSRNGRAISSDELKRALIASPADESDDLYIAVQTLLHSISHLLMRNSEIYSGVARDAFAETIFTPHLAFMLYSQQGNELGALRTTFDSQMNLTSWFYAARRLADQCPHGNICLDKGGACHACLFVAERCCTSLWNEQLNRAFLISKGHRGTGYWEKPTP
jgi:hypothetical protein